MSEMYQKVCYYYRYWFKKTQVPTPPEDVEDLFKKYAQNEKVLLDSNLQKFLMAVQGEPQVNASETAKTAVEKSLKRSRTFSKKGLNLNDFLHFLLGKMNLPLPQQMQEDELQHSLPHYFVQTSHHSDLKQQNTTHPTSNEEYQKINSSISGIETALKRGVRVIELKLCPSSDNTNVEVYNEWAPHSSITMSKWLDVVRDNAFKRSDFPVIIILVEHINLDLLAKVADKISRKFDGMLCKSDDTFNGHLGNLKKKFIVLRRQPKQESRAPNEKEEPYKDYGKFIAGHIEEMDDRLINLQEGEGGNFRILSTTENLLEHARSSDIISFTQKNILAVYPNSSPQDDETVTSNFDPLIALTRGAQMVALDTQKQDKYLWIMQGLFRAYGNSGYVKKPDILLNKEQKFDPAVWRPVKKILKVKVYMGTGWHLDYDSKEFDDASPPDFFAALEIVGVPEDEAREKTVPAIDQWIPTWNQEFEFPLTVPELAMLMIEVREFDPDRSHDFGGQTCLPVWLLRKGIRSVPLYRKDGKQLRAVKLLLGFQID